MNNCFEGIQKGNPYRLTKEQHFIPKSHIKRFENINQKVFCKNKISKNKKTIEINSNDSIFKVQRLWAEFAEKGYMKNIEDNFSNLVDDILDDSIKKFTKEQSRVICDMYTLWEGRIFHIKRFLKNQNLYTKLYGINGTSYTKDEEERIESFYMSYMNKGGEIPSRDTIAGQILVYINGSPYRHIKWGILKSDNIEFIMPSNPYILFFPISPNYCLIPYQTYGKMNNNDVNSLNNIMIDNSKWFYFWK